MVVILYVYCSSRKQRYQNAGGAGLTQAPPTPQRRLLDTVPGAVVGFNSPWMRQRTRNYL